MYKMQLNMTAVNDMIYSVYALHSNDISLSLPVLDR